MFERLGKFGRMLAPTLKIVLPTKIKTFLILGVLPCLLVFLILLGGALGEGVVLEDKIITYQYGQKADLDYQVLLKPNLLYGESVLGRGKTYPSNFVDEIQTTWTYEFQGNKKAEIKGHYQLIALLRGVLKEQNKEKILWQKEYLLIPPQDFQSDTGNIFLQENVLLTFALFNQFNEEVQKETGIISDADLLVGWQIELEAANEAGLVQEEFTPQLVVPLGKKHFEIGGDLVLEESGALEEVMNIKGPLNKGKIVFCGLGFVLFLLGLLYLCFFVRGISPSPWEKQVKQVFKNYGERLVALEKEILFDEGVIIRTKSLSGLVLLADELCQPIYYYQKDGDGGESFLFYVFNENRLSLYELKPQSLYLSFQQGFSYS